MSQLNSILPNLFYYFNEFIESIIETLLMVGISGSISIILGLILGVVLIITRKDGLYENRIINRIVDLLTNIFRAIPFIILIAMLIDVTKFITGEIYGVRGVVFPLIVGCTPFFVRQVDLSLSEVDEGLIEAAKAMGLSRMQIIFKVYLRESIPSLCRSVAITLISLLGLTASAGVVGGGGIGSFVIRYGYSRTMPDITWVSVIVILIIVIVIQLTCDIIAKKNTH